MPEIKLQHVVSCSSEDQMQKADNLLKSETYRKWKCASVGEKQASVILQFEKSSIIHSIDIGNEGAAFIEILVGRLSSDKPDDYQVLLVTSSFMSPSESKSGTNTNRVRFFGPGQLTKTVVDKSWDRVKIVCTQPFNKTSTYGLSFIKFHSAPDHGEKSGDKGMVSSHQDINKLGHFKLKETNQSTVPIGSYFKNRNEVKPAPAALMGAAAVRAASSLAEQSIQIGGSPSSLKKVRTDSQKTPSPRQQTPLTKRKSADFVKTENVGAKQPRQSSDVSRLKTESPPMKKRKSDSNQQSPAKALNRLMDGVVFVISGYQNPHRSDLRDKALDMGAKYKPDWGPGCTHLICAFANTPKYQDVKGKGIIVRKDWILDSYKRKKLMPWKRYTLTTGDASSSDDEEEEEEEMNTSVKRQFSVSPAGKPKSPRMTYDDKDDTDGGMDTDDDKNAASTSVNQVELESSGVDTEDEIKRIQHNDDSYGSSTDVDSDTEKVENQRNIKNEQIKDRTKNEDETKCEGEGGDIPELPDFFNDKHFLLYGTFDDLERRHLVRYITAFDGVLEDYMSDGVSHIITKCNWDDNFDQALVDNTSLAFVRPKWIFVCGEKGRLVPYQPFLVVPQ